jgi:hypothetical protein
MIRYLVLLAFAPLQAHSLYILPQRFAPAAGEQILLSIQSGDSFPNSEDGADPGRFVAPRVISPTGETPLTTFRLVGLKVLSAARIEGAGAHWVTISTKPRAFELDAERFTPYLTAEGLEWVAGDREKSGSANKPGRERYSKYAKSLVVSGPADLSFLRKPIGLAIEIVPLTDPAKIKPGGVLPIQLLYRGKPAEGVQVEAAWASEQKAERRPAGRTGADGRLSIRLPRSGMWRLNAVLMERCADSSVADWESYWASLTFEVP